VPQGIAAAAVTNAGGVAIDAHDADHRADVRASLAGNDAEAIVLDFVQPLAAGWQLIGFGWEARRDEPGGRYAATCETSYSWLTTIATFTSSRSALVVGLSWSHEASRSVL
jgi:hypothetical protein